MKKILSIVLALTLLLAVLPASAFASSSRKIYVSCNGKGTLNLRSGPGYEYESIGYVHHNDRVKVYESSGVWSRIKYKGKTGWIRTMYIDGTTKALGTGFKAIVAATNVYSSADATAVVGFVTTADTVKVYYTERDFASVHVSDSGLSGWIPISCIGGTVKLTADNPPVDSDAVYRTTASTLNVRSGPGTGFAVIGQLPRNTGCAVLETSGSWYRIRSFGGVVGWVSSYYLKATSTARVTASALNVRKGPGTSSAILGSFKRGTKVTVKYTVGNWAYVTSGRLTGYVSMTYLRF